jgi:hypothetical protein
MLFCQKKAKLTLKKWNKDASINIIRKKFKGCFKNRITFIEKN